MLKEVLPELAEEGVMIISESVIIARKRIANHAQRIDITILLRQVFLFFVVTRIASRLGSDNRLLLISKTIKIEKNLVIYSSIDGLAKPAFDSAFRDDEKEKQK